MRVAMLGILVLAAAVALVAVACGGGGAEPTPTPTTQVVAKTPTPTATLPPGVTPSPSPPTPTPTRVVVAVTPTPAPKRGGILQTTTSAIAPNIDLHLVLTAGLIVTGPAVSYSGLLRFVHNAENAATGRLVVECDLCESWSQPDQTTLIFKLRQGVKWAPDLGYAVSRWPGLNGRELTAEDVKWSLDRERTNEPIYLNKDLLASVKDITAVDKYTVKITLKQPDADLLLSLADNKSGILPPEPVLAQGDVKAGPIIGTGPWIFTEGARDTGWSYVRNPDYFDKAPDGKSLPYLDGWKQLVIRDQATILAAFRAGQTASTGPTPSDFKIVQKEHPDWPYRIRQNNVNRYDFTLSCTKPPFDDINVRRAALYAHNPKDIIDVAWEGAAWISPGFFLPDTSWALPEQEFMSHFADLNKAKDFMAKSAYAGQTLSVDLPTSDYLGIGFTNTGLIIKDQLKAIGITINVKPQEGATWVASILNGSTWQAWAGSNVSIPTSAGLITNHKTGGTRAGHGCSDATLDAKIDAQAQELDPAKRKAMIQDIQRYILDKAYKASTSGITNEMWQPWLKDYYSLGYTYDARHWRLAWFDK